MKLIINSSAIVSCEYIFLFFFYFILNKLIMTMTNIVLNENEKH